MRGALWHMAVAAFFFSAMAVCVKLVPRLPVVEVVFFRALVAGLLSLAFLRARGNGLWGHNKRLLILRGVFGTGGLVAYFTTLHALPLATATVIQYLSPVFTALIAAFAVRERVPARRWFCFGVSFLGVALLKGYDPTVEWRELTIGVLGSLSSAFAYNCIARLKDSEDPQVIMFYFPVITVPLTLPLTIIHWMTPTPMEWATLVLTGVLVQTAQYFMTRSYQSGRPAAVSIVSYLGVLFALLWDVLFFNAVPSKEAGAGITLVVMGVVLSAALDLGLGRKESTATS